MVERADGAILIVVNPTSGRGRASIWARIAEQRLRAEGLAVRTSTEPAESRALVGGTDAAWREIWIAGGDGTLNAVIAALPAHPPPVALLPAGTGNVVARDFAIPLSFEGAFTVARTGVLCPLDIGRANGRSFAFMASAGLDGALVHWVATHRRGPMRRTDWVRAAFARCGSAEPPIRIRADGRELGAARYVAAFNCGFYAGGFRVCPRARHDDGQLELLLLREPILPRWPRVVLAALCRRPHELPDAELHSVRTIEWEIEGGGPAQAQLDGDPFDDPRASITLSPAAVRLRAPLSSGR